MLYPQGIKIADHSNDYTAFANLNPILLKQMKHDTRLTLCGPHIMSKISASTLASYGPDRQNSVVIIIKAKSNQNIE